MDSTGYPASDEPIRARVECYSPRWQILMSDNATREVFFRTYMAVNAYSNKLCVLLEPHCSFRFQYRLLTMTTFFEIAVFSNTKREEVQIFFLISKFKKLF